MWTAYRLSCTVCANNHGQRRIELDDGVLAGIETADPLDQQLVKLRHGWPVVSTTPPQLCSKRQDSQITWTPA